MLQAWPSKRLPVIPSPSATDAGRTVVHADLAVVTVAYHSQAALPHLARDLARQSRPPARWVLVDNCPESAPVACAGLELLPQLLTGREGDGFGVGCNRGLDTLADSGWRGWVWLLNPDTALPSGDELEQLLGLLGTLPPSTLVGTAVWDGKAFEASGGWLDPGLRFRRRRLGPAQLDAGGSVAVDWLSGCNLLLQPEAHRPPARFDPRFPLYYEDMDLCRRLAAAGASVLWLPRPVVQHRRGSGSAAPSPRRVRLSTLSYLRFLGLHSPGWVFALRSLRLLLINLLRLPVQPRRSLAALGGLVRVLGEGGGNPKLP